MKRMVYTNSGSTLATIIIPADPNVSDAYLIGLVPPDATNAHICDHTEIPSDRTYRNAWRKEPGKPVEVDMEKARDIQRDSIRAVRAPLLEKLDAEYLRADERGDAQTKAAIAAQKQALRDATADPRIDAAVTPDDLKAVTLEVDVIELPVIKG